jgi:hypothetical protein
MNLLLLSSFLAIAPSAGTDTRAILDAIRTVETGGERDPDSAIGDGGRALGAYQIHRAYWLDATASDPALRALGYESVTDRAIAERVVLAYLTRYAPRWDLDTVSRIHNGGPKGHLRASTKDYATKVAKAAKGATR